METNDTNNDLIDHQVNLRSYDSIIKWQVGMRSLTQVNRYVYYAMIEKHERDIKLKKLLFS